MPYRSLLASFDRYLPLNDEEGRLLVERTSQRKIKRRHFILQEGQVCKHYSYVVEGCLKMYGVGKRGTEHNVEFAAEGEWIVDMGSFYSGQPSVLFIEAIEPTLILQIQHSDMLYLFENVPKLDRNFRVIIEDKFIELQKRLLQNISSTAEERYLAFVERNPTLALRLPSTQVASHLGITPEFLSKIRKDIANRPRNP